MANFNVNGGNGVDPNAVEKFLAARGEKGVTQDGKLDANEVSLWDKLKGSVTPDEANEFGFSELDLGHTKGARRAADGPDVVVNVNNNININIQIDVNVEKILEDFMKNFDIDALVNKLAVEMQKNEKAMEQFLVGLINSFADNINVDLSKVQDLLDQILERLKTVEGVVVDIESNTAATNSLLKQQLDIMQTMGVDINKLIEKFDAYVEGDKITQAEQNKILGDIYEALNKFIDQDGYFDADFSKKLNILIEKLGNSGSGVDLTAVLELLAAIKTDTSKNNEISQNILDKVVEGNETSKEILQVTKDIYEAIKGLDVDMKEGFNNIVLQIINSGDNVTAKMDELKALLEAIKTTTAGIKGDTADIKEVNNLILAAIKALDIGSGSGATTVIVDLTELLNEVKKGNLALEGLKELLQAIKNNTDTIKEDTASIKEDTAVNKQTLIDILAAIKTLGAETTANFTAVLNKIGQGKDCNCPGIDAFEALFEKVLAAINNNTEVSKENKDEIIEAINGLDLSIDIDSPTVNVDLSKIEKTLGDILKVTGDNNTVLNEIKGTTLENNQVLKDILAKLGKLDNIDDKLAGVSNNLTLITSDIAHIKNYLDELEIPAFPDVDFTDILNRLDTIIDKIPGEHECDHTAILNWLDEIWQAIKELKLECHCNCNGTAPQNKDESVDDNDRPVNAKRRAQGTDNIDIAKVQDCVGKVKTALGTKAPFETDTTAINEVVFQKSKQNPGVHFNLAGQQISESEKGIHIVDGKKYLVR